MSSTGDRSLRRLVADALNRGSSTRISFDHREYTLPQLHQQACRLAARLAACTQVGERVLVMSRNSPESLITWWACQYAGLVTVPVNVANRSLILEHQIRDCAPVVAILQPEFTALVAGAVEEAGTRLRLVVLTDPDDAWPVRPGQAPEVETFAQALSGSATDFQPVERPLSLPSHLIYTAGTTGPSKGCMVGDGYVQNMSRQMNENLGKRPDEVLWTAMPLFHLAAVAHVAGALQIGGSISLASRFSVSRFWEDVHRSEASLVALMGSMIPMLATAPETEWTARCRGQLRVVSGSPVTADLARIWAERFGVHRVGSGAYGMTEAALITSCSVEEYRPGSAGRVNDSFEVRVVDEFDEPVPVGETGEIVARPTRPGIMFQGYWGDPGKTLEVFRNLWFHTGDHGRFDSDGHLRFMDRGKDYLRRGGENISSYEIEQIFARHPEVAEVAVHAVPSELSEDEVKVTVVLVAGSALTEAELVEWSEDLVPRYARPEYVEFRSELPKNPVGRVLKYQLRDEGCTDRTWRRAHASRSLSGGVR